MEKTTVLRELHNQIKNDIITNAYIHIPYQLPPLEPTVLDLACGRGGDVHKYYHANFKRLFVIDNHRASLDVYRKRFEKSYRTVSDFKIDFILHDLASDVFCMKKQVDVVVMNFALNYFFKSQRVLETLMKTVSVCLKNGGSFVGIALDGVKVREAVMTNRLNEHCVIEPLSTFFNDNVYNRAYNFSLKNCDYFNFRNGGAIEEYLVCLNELDRVAYQFELHKIYHQHVIDNDNSVTGLNVVFKYQKRTQHDTTLFFPTVIDNDNSQKRTQHDTTLFFPTVIDSSRMRILPETKSVCSRPEASSVLISTIEQNTHKKIELIIDATAHVGCDSLMLALHFHEARIVAIEQQPETADILQQNIEASNVSNVTVIHGDCLDHLYSTNNNTNKNYIIDVLYIDAPWGGHEYKQHKQVSLYLNDTELSDVVLQYKNRVGLFVLKVPLNFNTCVFCSSIAPLQVHTTTYFVATKPKFHFLTIKSPH